MRWLAKAAKHVGAQGGGGGKACVCGGGGGSSMHSVCVWAAQAASVMLGTLQDVDLRSRNSTLEVFAHLHTTLIPVPQHAPFLPLAALVWR
jgi:predicted Rossmann-fold nucleotide-binding protein